MYLIRLDRELQYVHVFRISSEVWRMSHIPKPQEMHELPSFGIARAMIFSASIILHTAYHSNGPI
jgi:hypothetical protein